MFFFPDASLTGWGGPVGRLVISQISSHLPSPPNISVWNWKRYDWPYFSGTSVAQQTVRVYCDNSTVVAYFRKQRGTDSISLFNKTLELFYLLDQFAILLFPHLPGARNVTADTLSRINSPSPTEWRIPKETLHNLFSVLVTPLVDMFAIVENKGIPVYVSHHPDEIAWAVDSLSISWVGLGLVYA